MADTAHLEKMGRELKCPICLSLLNSAVSLTCNHVFCNLCIMKSMKLDSNCPVCKVPYQRREVRPAPHMDNLVSIYKSMEVASGFKIFVTQTAIPDEENQAACMRNFCGPNSGGVSSGTRRRKRKSKEERLEKLVKAKTEVTRPQIVKTSFPAKKRVQVPRYPPSETPTRPEKCEIGQSDQARHDGPKNDAILSKEKCDIDENREPMLSPFFWLREEEDEALEKSSAQMVEDGCFMDNPTPVVPCFSDIKDSDDEIDIKVTPNGEVRSESRADILDSEMFEWTQRACSPELFSTPLKDQVASTDEYDGAVQEVDCVKDSQIFSTSINKKSINAQVETDILDPVFSSPKINNSKDHNGSKTSSKTNKKTKERTQRKRRKCVDGLEKLHTTTEISRNSNSAADGNHSLNLGKRSRGRKTICDAGAADGIPEGVLTVSVDANAHNQVYEKGTEFPFSSGKENYKDGNLNCLSKPSKSGKNINSQFIRSHPRRVKNQNRNFGRDKVLEEISLNQTQGSEKIRTQSPALSCTIVTDGKVSITGKGKGKKAKKIKPQSQGKRFNEPCRQRGMKISTGDGAKNGVADGGQTDSMGDAIKEIQTINVAVKDTQTIKVVTENHGTGIINYPESAQKVRPVVKDMLLNKCENASNKDVCAFCHSSEESEASGEMVHYFNGRPVAADYSGGSDVIHSHKNCTEWAPNAYFEDDVVINLEAEVARSRRIKCSCCGIKGAALGCYEKSCRKSFHVPCAKLVPQCRWDMDNFVILCPLHFSSKLPNETSGRQSQRRKRCSSKGLSNPKKSQVAVSHNVSSIQQWKCSGSSKTWVLCCSALTDSEKDTVSEFSRLSGASLSKSWDLSVTHVISSTNENGACRRTLKVLMGILEGKWILKIDWIKACMKAMEPVDEENYEIKADIHGIQNGPHLGRLRILNKQPKLFNGLKFYFTGEFVPSYKGYLQDLVAAAGGTVLQRKPISGCAGGQLSGSSTFTTFIVYSLDLPDKCDSDRKSLILKHRQSNAEALASLSGSKIVSHSWITDSIAACKLQGLV